MATSYRHGGCSRKMRVHTLHHKQEAKSNLEVAYYTHTAKPAFLAPDWGGPEASQRSGIPDQFSEVFTP